MVKIAQIGGESDLLTLRDSPPFMQRLLREYKLHLALEADLNRALGQPTVKEPGGPPASIPEAVLEAQQKRREIKQAAAQERQRAPKSFSFQEAEAWDYFEVGKRIGDPRLIGWTVRQILDACSETRAIKELRKKAYYPKEERPNQKLNLVEFYQALVHEPAFKEALVSAYEFLIQDFPPN